MTVVVDASAVMALMLNETGADVVMRVVRGSRMSAVNVSDCCSRGVERGASPTDVLTILNTYEIEIVAFDLALAIEAARLREPTRAQGASLGDRACLALASSRGLPVYTSDRRLADIDPALGIYVHLIR